MVQPCISFPQFDKKYKIIVDVPYADDYFEKIEWVNINSINDVDVKIESEKIFFAFSNSDDALIFKIRYLL